MSTGAAAATLPENKAALNMTQKVPKGWPRHCGRKPIRATWPSPRLWGKGAGHGGACGRRGSGAVEGCCGGNLVHGRTLTLPTTADNNPLSPSVQTPVLTGVYGLTGRVISGDFSINLVSSRGIRRRLKERASMTHTWPAFRTMKSGGGVPFDTQASILVAHPKIQEWIAANTLGARNQISALVPEVIKVLSEILAGGHGANAKVMVDAGKTIMSRGGLPESKELAITSLTMSLHALARLDELRGIVDPVPQISQKRDNDDDVIELAPRDWQTLARHPSRRTAGASSQPPPSPPAFLGVAVSGGIQGTRRATNRRTWTASAPRLSVNLRFVA